MFLSLFNIGQRFLNANQKSSDIEKIAADLAKETVHPSYRPASAATTDSNGLTPDPSNASNPSGGKPLSHAYSFCKIRKNAWDVNV